MLFFLSKLPWYKGWPEFCPGCNSKSTYGNCGSPVFNPPYLHKKKQFLFYSILENKTTYGDAPLLADDWYVSTCGNDCVAKSLTWPSSDILWAVWNSGVS